MKTTSAIFAGFFLASIRSAQDGYRQGYYTLVELRDLIATYTDYYVSLFEWV